MKNVAIILMLVLLVVAAAQAGDPAAKHRPPVQIKPTGPRGTPPPRVSSPTTKPATAPAAAPIVPTTAPAPAPTTSPTTAPAKPAAPKLPPPLPMPQALIEAQKLEDAGKFEQALTVLKRSASITPLDQRPLDFDETYRRVEGKASADAVKPYMQAPEEFRK
jgi:hypothetical protein